MYSIGERVVYPNQGIARVEEIQMRETGAGPAPFYLLRIEAGGSTVIVPIANAREVGLRPPIGSDECGRLLELLAAPFADSSPQWKDRQKEYLEKTRTGDVFSLADVLKQLTYLDLAKPLSFREKRVLERARSLVIGEVAIAVHRTERDAESMIDRALATAMENHALEHTRAAAAAAPDPRPGEPQVASRK